MKGQWKSTGDPTEVALQVFGMKLGLGRSALTSDTVIPEKQPGRPALGPVIEELGTSEKDNVRFIDSHVKPEEKRFEMKAEFPFSSELKRMTTIYLDKQTNQAIVLIKGAVSIFSFDRLFSC